MAKLLEMVSATTGDFEKLNSSGTQYANEGYSNRIRLREESHSNVMENLASGVIDSKVSVVADEVVQDTSPIYSITSVGDSFEQVSPCKAIMLNSEKMAVLSEKFRDVTEEIVENSDEVAEEAVVESEVVPEFAEVDGDVQSEISESVVVDDSQFVVSEEQDVAIVEQDAEIVNSDTVSSETDTVISYADVDMSDVAEMNQKLQEKVEATLLEKQLLDQAKKEEEEAKKRYDEQIEKAERDSKEKIEECNRKLLEASAENAELEAVRLAKKEELEASKRDTIAMAMTQTDTLEKQRQDYIQQRQSSKLNVEQMELEVKNKLTEIDKRTIDETKDTDAKFMEIERDNEQKRLDIAELDDELAKEAQLRAAMAGYIGLDTDVSFSDSNEISYRKVA